MTTADTALTVEPTGPGFHVTRPEDLGAREPIHLYPGIRAYPLRYSSPTDGSAPVPTELYVEFTAGYGYPEPDRHHTREVVAVLWGTLLDDNPHGTYPPGSRIEAAAGTSHTPRSDTGCMLLVTFPDL